MIELSNISKIYNGNFIFKDITVSIIDKDKIGLVGSNGAGKSTLLKIICGQEYPDSGQISISDKIKIGYLAQNSGLKASNTIISEMRAVFKEIFDIKQQMEEMEKEASKTKLLSEKYSNLQTIYEQSDGYSIEFKIKNILNGMGFENVPLSTKINTLSGGEKTRLALAKLLLEQPTFLVLDEPTNHLDFKTLAWLESYINEKFTGTVLLVSHDRWFLDKCVDKIWEIESKTLHTYKGNYSNYAILKKSTYEKNYRDYQKQQKEIEKLREYVSKNKARASTAKLAKSRQKILNKMEIVEKPNNVKNIPNIIFTFDLKPYNNILDVKNMNITVSNNSRSKTLFSNLNLHIHRGEKLAIIGENGIGKSSFLKAIQGLIPHGGQVKWGQNVKISYYRQDLSNLNPNHSALDEMSGRNPKISELEIRKQLAKVQIISENALKNVGDLSGGEKARLCFAIIMMEKPNVMILDEPTNHLDLETREVLESALIKYEGTLIIVSHDRYMLDRVPTKIMKLNPGNAEIIEGKFSDLIGNEKLNSTNLENFRKSSPANQNKSRKKRVDRAKKRAMSKELEQKISDTETKIKELEAQIASPDVYTDYTLINDKCLELENAKKEYEKYFEMWANITEQDD